MPLLCPPHTAHTVDMVHWSHVGSITSHDNPGNCGCLCNWTCQSSCDACIHLLWWKPHFALQMFTLAPECYDIIIQSCSCNSHMLLVRDGHTGSDFVEELCQCCVYEHILQMLIRKQVYYRATQPPFKTDIHTRTEEELCAIFFDNRWKLKQCKDT